MLWRSKVFTGIHNRTVGQKTEVLQMQPLAQGTVQAGTIQKETVHAETVQKETPPADTQAEGAESFKREGGKMSLPKPYYQDSHVTIYNADCREILPLLDPVDLVLTDPPYGKVKGDFDKIWTNRDLLLIDCKDWLDVIYNKMKPNATLYWFAWPSLAGKIESMISERLNILSHIVWRKPSPTAQKACPELLRAPMPETERIIMAEHYGADNMALGESGYMAKCDDLRGFVFEPIRAYLAGEFFALGWKAGDLNRICGTASMAGRHYTAKSQWCLPRLEHYTKLQAASQGQHLRREYEDLRRYFDMRTGDPKTDVWEFAPEYKKYGHPTVKPQPLIAYMVRLSCRPNGTILDPFMGSGTTLRAAKDLNRKAIGIELEEKYCAIAVERLRQEVLAL